MQRIQVGQVWKQETTGEAYLVTRIFTEGLATYVLLRKSGAESEPRVRVKVERQGDGQRLAGYSYAQEADEA
jgi:hypothetical protein